MYIRCGSCLATTWLDSLTPGESGLTDECKTCGFEFSLMGALELGMTSEDQEQRVRQFAEYNDFDMPSAWSVLLGLLPVETARDRRERRRTDPAPAAPPAPTATPSPPAAQATPASRPAAKAAPPPTPPVAPVPTVEVQTPAPDVPSRRRLPYDVAFKPAVDAGLLTPMQASERGKRSAYAANLKRRHGLPRPLAEDVADNRISLHAAVQKVRAAAPPPPPAPARLRRKSRPPAPAWQKALVAALALAALAGIGAFGLMRWRATVAYSRAVADASTSAVTAAATAARRDEAPPPQPGPDPAATAPERGSPADPGRRARVRLDDAGRVVRVIGPNPDAVLEAYCTASKGGLLEPVTVEQARPPMPGVRVGVFREVADYYAITIRRDRETRGWYVGNGTSPIVPAQRAETPAADDRIARAAD